MNNGRFEIDFTDVSKEEMIAASVRAANASNDIIIMAIETEMFRLLFLCHGKGELDGVIYEREGTANYVRE